MEDYIEMDAEDFASPQEEEPTQETQEAPETNEEQSEVEDTKPTDGTPETSPETPEQPLKIKVKYNHEEMELPLDEAAQLAQKGLNYEKAVERAKQEARDAYIAEQGYTWQGKPITTEAEYRAAMAEKELIEKYQDRDIPEEVIKELMESRRDREERQREKEARAEQEKKDAMLNDFLDYFQSVNDRPFDSTKDKIPQEVRDAVDKGESLKIAYMQYHNKELRNQLKIAKQNEENLKKAPVGSVTANGVSKAEVEDDFLRGFNSIE